MRRLAGSILSALCLLSTAPAYSQEKAAASNDAAELAKKLANPVAAMISVPFQNNTDLGIGPLKGYRNTLNFQPVIPMSLNKQWNLITRVVLPIVTQENVFQTPGKQSGLSDAVMSAFFSPAQPKNGLIWGVGPAILIPTATNKMLGTEKLGVGPTGLVLKQANGWTIGGLVNQIWSIAGSATRNDVSQMFVQPFLTYNYKSGAGLGVSAEITQNWKASATSAVLVPNVSAVTKLGKQIVSLAVGPRIPLSMPSGSEYKFGVRAAAILVFPK